MINVNDALSMLDSVKGMLASKPGGLDFSFVTPALIGTLLAIKSISFTI